MQHSYNPVSVELFVVRNTKLLLSIAVLIVTLSINSEALAIQAKKLSYQLIASYPHNTDYFTQGLYYDAPYLYESTGLYKKSRLIQYQLKDKQLKLLKEKRLPDNIFAEGLVAHQEQLILLTYKAQRAFVFDKQTFKVIKQFNYQGQGWGLTYGMNQFFMTNGSQQLLIRDRDDFSIVHQLPITFNGKALPYVNEMEWVNGLIVANIWYDKRIVWINPFSAKVHAYLDLTDLMKQYGLDANKDHVLNGIAYDKDNDIFYITGKNWPLLFAIKVNF